MQFEADAADDQVRALKTRKLPQLNLHGSVSENLQDQEYTFEQGVWNAVPPIPSEDVTIKSATDTTGILSASATQPLSQLYELRLNIEQGEIQQDLTLAQKRLTEQDIARVVKQVYFEIVQTQSDLQVTTESIRFYKSLRELVYNYVKQQISLNYELLEVEARLARRELDATRLRNQLSTQMESMNDLLARDLNTDFTVQQLPEQVLTVQDEDEAIATALQQRPDIQKSRLQIKYAELDRDIIKAGYIPDIDLRLRYTRLYNYDLIPDTDTYVGLQAKWEFFDWGRKRNEISGKERMVRAASNSTREIENRVIIDVRKSYRRIVEAQQSVTVSKLAQSAARDKLRVLMSQYEQQSTLLQNVLDAETELDRAHNEYNRAILSVWKARAGLDHSLGTT